jgi:hypothetical protein
MPVSTGVCVEKKKVILYTGKDETKLRIIIFQTKTANFSLRRQIV